VALFLTVSSLSEVKGESEVREREEQKRSEEVEKQSEEPDPFAWHFGGDFRLRYERTTNQEAGATPDRLEPRNRGVVRFRTGVTKKLNGMFDFGVRVATGDPDDPNSSDVTLGQFLDDLTISLDRAYLGMTYGGLYLTGGKFANPFIRTDLVWDGDVNPQGAAGRYTYQGSQTVNARVTGIYFIVDESTVQRDSYMWGGQTELLMRPSSEWNLRLAGGFYDYTINSLRRADAGDIRGNRVTPDGTALVSDFDLLDLIAIVEYRGFGERHPLRFVGDYVKNFGHKDHEHGFMLDFFVGRAANENDLRFRYGYAQCQTDCVLAAFSNDNTTFATNYRQHTVTIDYLPIQNLVLNATWYAYRRLETLENNPWITRLRLNAMVRF
jgi:hypothetical protein